MRQKKDRAAAARRWRWRQRGGSEQDKFDAISCQTRWLLWLSRLKISRITPFLAWSFSCKAERLNVMMSCCCGYFCSFFFGVFAYRSAKQSHQLSHTKKRVVHEWTRQQKATQKKWTKSPEISRSSESSRNWKKKLFTSLRSGKRERRRMSSGDPVGGGVWNEIVWDFRFVYEPWSGEPGKAITYNFRESQHFKPLSHDDL